MSITGSVILHRLFLDGFLRHLQGDVDTTIFSGGSGKHGHFKGCQRLAGIAIGLKRQMSQSIIVHHQRHLTQPSLFIRRSPAQQSHNLIIGHRFQGEHLRAAEHGRIDGKIGILRGSADETDCSLLEMRQQHILLSLIEAVQLIHKQNSLLPVNGHARTGLLNFGADFAYIRLHSVEHHKKGTGAAGNDVCQRGLTHTGRSVENEG